MRGKIAIRLWHYLCSRVGRQSQSARGARRLRAIGVSLSVPSVDYERSSRSWNGALMRISAVVASEDFGRRLAARKKKKGKKRKEGRKDEES